MPRTMYGSSQPDEAQDQPESSSFGDDFAAALDAAAGRKVSDQEALDFMNSEEGQHAIGIYNMPDDKVVEAGNDDPLQAKLEHIGYVFDTWAGRHKTVPGDLMSSQNPMIEPVSR